jgi:hypothetical protein
VKRFELELVRKLVADSVNFSEVSEFVLLKKAPSLKQLEFLCERKV